jgi:hypothetical protein
MRKLICATAIAAATLGSSLLLASPAMAQDCFSVGNDGVCYDPVYNTATVPSENVGTPPTCLGPLGCRPGTTIVSTPAEPVDYWVPWNPCAKAGSRYVCLPPLG